MHSFNSKKEYGQWKIGELLKSGDFNVVCDYVDFYLAISKTVDSNGCVDMVIHAPFRDIHCETWDIDKDEAAALSAALEAAYKNR